MKKLPIIIIVIGIIIPILAVAQLLRIDDQKHLRYIDGPGDELTIKLHDDDEQGEIGFSFWIKGDFTDSDANGLWDDCETFNASVKGPDGNKTERYIPLCDNRDGEFKDIGLIKVGEACKSVKEENTTIGCPDGNYVITANSESRVRYDDEALGEVLIRGLLAGAGCCCGTLIILLGIILAFTMQDDPDFIQETENHPLLTKDKDDSSQPYEKKGWDEQEDYIRKEKESEPKEPKKEVNQDKGEYEIPPPPPE